MVLDMTNANSTTIRVMVSFHPVDTDDTCSSCARTSAIQKLDVPLSGDEDKDLVNFVYHLKTFTGLAENPEVTNEVHKAFFCRNF